MTWLILVIWIGCEWGMYRYGGVAEVGWFFEHEYTL